MLALQSQGFGDAGLGDVAPYQQIQPYSCGAAALKAVMGHWGDHVDEPILIREIGIDPQAGSTALQVAMAARRRGYLGQMRRFSNIEELGSYTNRDIPVIIAIRSFTRPNQGHFVVATRVKPTVVEVMDPNVKGNRRTIPRRELDQRWQFRDRVGVIVVPKRKKSTLADAAPTPPKRALALAITGAIVAASITVGVVMARRRKAA